MLTKRATGIVWKSVSILILHCPLALSLPLQIVFRCVPARLLWAEIPIYLISLLSAVSSQTSFYCLFASSFFWCFSTASAVGAKFSVSIMALKRERWHRTVFLSQKISLFLLLLFSLAFFFFFFEWFSELKWSCSGTLLQVCTCSLYHLFSLVSDMRGMSTSACPHGTVLKTDVLCLGLIYDRQLNGQPWHVQEFLPLFRPQDVQLK